jgi:hypothetical protein
LLSHLALMLLDKVGQGHLTKVGRPTLLHLTENICLSESVVGGA